MANTRISKNLYSLLRILIVIPTLAFAELQHQPSSVTAKSPEADVSLPDLIYASSEPFSDINTANLDDLLERIGDARVVLLGESSHGTLEFYEMRARITRELIKKKGFKIIAIEADWPDASRIDFYSRGADRDSKRRPGHSPFHGPMYNNSPFAVFPEWMWRNQSVLTFTHWLKDYNRSVHSVDDTVSIYGIDIYNLFGSIEVVLDYLQQANPQLAKLATRHYSCLFPWAHDPSEYGRALKSGKARKCENGVNAVLQDLLGKEPYLKPLDKQRYFSAVQNARLIQNGERYFRTMTDDDTDAWNQRDGNMFERLQAILNFHGETTKAVVWAHNTHLGDSRGTDMKDYGQINLGQRVREAFGDSAYIIGMGTDHGEVAAAPRWDRPVEIQQVPPSHQDSYEYLLHQVKADNFMLPLRHAHNDVLREKLLAERMERGIGVAYDPKNELKKHYYRASLPRQFDEYIFFDETHAVKPTYKR